jgi:microcystin-dependent protein
MSVKDSLGYYNSPIPVGTVTAFAGANPPPTWALCDGASYPSPLSTEPTLLPLFDVIGYTYSQLEAPYGLAGDALQGTITFAQYSQNFTAVVTQGFLYSGKRIIIEITPAPSQVLQAVLVATYDDTTGAGTFEEGVEQYDGSLGKPFVSDPDYFNLPYLNGRAIIGGATTSSTIVPASITPSASFGQSIAAGNLPAFNPAITASSFSASISPPNTYEAVQSTQTCDGAFASFAVATPFPTNNTFTPTFVSKTMTYTTTGSGGIPTPVFPTYTNLGDVTFNTLELTYIIKTYY